MWHLKTKFGVFWIAPAQKQGKYFLGIDDHELGLYENQEKAAEDVYEQATGFIKWDAQTRVTAPRKINEWAFGEPQEWKQQ